jgi:nucleoside-diphosphate-sugar epimerase
MKLFITGATGYIGYDVAKAFRRHGHEVWGLCRSETKARILQKNEIHPVIGNIGNPQSYRKIAEQCAVLVHCAIDHNNPIEMEKATVRELAEAACCGHQQKTLIYTSGVWVYGNTGNKPQDETEKLYPLEISGWRPTLEKIVVENNDIKGLVMRPGVVYGKRGGLTGMWFAGVESGEIQIVGDGKNHWAMVHIDDVADAYVRAAESGLSGEIFNVVDRSRETVNDMVQAIAETLKFNGKITHVPLEEAQKQMGLFAEALVVNQHIDARKASRMLGWQPSHSGFIDDVDIFYQAWKAHQQ